MGSGGGKHYFGDTDPGALRERLRDAEQKTIDTEFEGNVAALITLRLSAYNDRDVRGVSNLLDQILAELSDEMEGSVKLIFGGSVAKNTYVQGLSDIDALVLVHQSHTDDSPSVVRQRFVDALKARYGNDAVSGGRLAVTIVKDGFEVQLVPAVRDGEHYKISNADGTSWAPIRPRYFADLLTKRNSELSGKLVPTIKLVKAIVSSLPEQRRLTGYHIEALALKSFETYEGGRTPKEMVQHFFENSPNLVRTPIVDPTGQSQFVDSYLDDSGPVQRVIVADALERISRRIKNANGSRSLQSWEDLLREPES